MEWMFIIAVVYLVCGIALGLMMSAGSSDDGTKYCKLKQGLKVAIFWPIAVFGILSWKK